MCFRLSQCRPALLAETFRDMRSVDESIGNKTLVDVPAV